MTQYELIQDWREEAERLESEGRELEYENDSSTVWKRERFFAEALVYRKCANALSAMTY
jgi:hypothetical protein